MLTSESALRKDLTTGIGNVFQHRHFAAIATILRNMDADVATREAWADALRATNPQFDRARFLKACGVES